MPNIPCFMWRSPPREDLSPEDLSVSLKCREPLQVSSFLTFNAAGEYFMPSYKVSRCPWCQAVTRREAATDVLINIIGQEVLGHRERQEFLALAEQRFPRYGMPYYYSYQSQYGYSSWKSNEPNWLPEPGSGAEANYAGPAKPAAFVIWRHGQSQHVSAEVMEEAAYLCPALAEALGWRTQPEQIVQNGKDDDQSAGELNAQESRKEELNNNE